ncbi:YqhG family protein, partial [Bacillus velezensis]|nr:YqhG family protein [Bacillus velezensis]
RIAGAGVLCPSYQVNLSVGADIAASAWVFNLQTEEKPEEYHLEKQALKALYQPKIHIQIENGGLFFLQSNFSG